MPPGHSWQSSDLANSRTTGSFFISVAHLRASTPIRLRKPSPPPFVYEGLDPALEPKSAVAEVSEVVKGTVHRIGDAIDKGRKPGMPLSILSNIAREAPLGSLLVAFLLGIAVARRL
jgi:hypothetical protein